MGNLYSIAGQRLFIGAVIDIPNADMAESDFNGQEWVEIDGWSTAGGIGDAAQAITTALINRGRDFKQKGTANAGQMANTFAIINDDPGQLAVIAASAPADKNNYAFKILWPDDPGGADGHHGSIRYFAGLVTTSQEAGGEANTMANLSATIEVNSNIVRVAASSGGGTAPVNTVLPAITGTATEGETLTSSTGTWTGTATITYAYQWFRAGVSILGATASTYDLTAGDVGHTVSVEVTGSNGIGSSRAISAATASVAGA